MDQVAKVARYSSSKDIHHQVHPFTHHLHLRDNMGRSHVCGRWTTQVWLFWSARGIATFRPLLVSFVYTCAFLILFLSVMSCVPLTQLFFQILISWFVSLSVVAGCHRVSEYHATLCLGSDSMANLFSHIRHQLMMP